MTCNLPYLRSENWRISPVMFLWHRAQNFKPANHTTSLTAPCAPTARCKFRRAPYEEYGVCMLHIYVSWDLTRCWPRSWRRRPLTMHKEMCSRQNLHWSNRLCFPHWSHRWEKQKPWDLVTLSVWTKTHSLSLTPPRRVWFLHQSNVDMCLREKTDTFGSFAPGSIVKIHRHKVLLPPARDLRPHSWLWFRWWWRSQVGCAHQRRCWGGVC